MPADRDERPGWLLPTALIGFVVIVGAVTLSWGDNDSDDQNRTAPTTTAPTTTAPTTTTSTVSASTASAGQYASVVAAAKPLAESAVPGYEAFMTEWESGATDLPSYAPFHDGYGNLLAAVEAFDEIDAGFSNLDDPPAEIRGLVRRTKRAGESLSDAHATFKGSGCTVPIPSEFDFRHFPGCLQGLSVFASVVERSVKVLSAWEPAL